MGASAGCSASAAACAWAPVPLATFTGSSYSSSTICVADSTLTMPCRLSFALICVDRIGLSAWVLVEGARHRASQKAQQENAV